MKKIITGVIVTAFCLTVGTAGTIFAAQGNKPMDADNNEADKNISISAVNSTGAGFTDEDNDGICDNAGTECGIKTGQGNNAGTGFTDEDNDGICDNAGTGCGIKNGQGNNAGAGFTDEDNDSICDNAGAGCGMKNGQANNIDKEGGNKNNCSNSRRCCKAAE